MRCEHHETSNRIDDSTASSVLKPEKVVLNQAAQRDRATAEIIFVKNQTFLCVVVAMNLVLPDILTNTAHDGLIASGEVSNNDFMILEAWKSTA